MHLCQTKQSSLIKVNPEKKAFGLWQCCLHLLTTNLEGAAPFQVFLSTKSWDKYMVCAKGFFFFFYSGKKTWVAITCALPASRLAVWAFSEPPHTVCHQPVTREDLLATYTWKLLFAVSKKKTSNTQCNWQHYVRVYGHTAEGSHDSQSDWRPNFY